MGRVSRRSLLRGGLGVGISLVAIWLLIRAVDIEAAFEVLRSASPAWIAIMFVTVFLDIGARGIRWRALLAPIARLPYRRVVGYTYLGYLANNVLPARLGELYRSHALGEGEGVSRTTVLGTVVVERVVDTVMVVAIAIARGPDPQRARVDDERRTRGAGVRRLADRGPRPRDGRSSPAGGGPRGGDHRTPSAAPRARSKTPRRVWRSRGGHASSRPR